MLLLMTAIQLLAGIGAGAGTVRSITTAFSVNRQIRELNISRQFMALTLEVLARNSRDIPMADGLDERMKRASRQDGRLLWLGVTLLIIGFLATGVAIVRQA